MTKTKKIQTALNDHYLLNLKLGSEYAQYAHVADADFDMPNLKKMILELSNDKLGIHKDMLSDYFALAGVEMKTSFNVESKSFKTAKEMVEYIRSEEIKVREEVAKIAKLAIEESDYETFEFIQWFIKDGLKDYGEIDRVLDIFNSSNDKLLIEEAIEESFEE